MTLVPEHHLKLPQTNGLLKHLEQSIDRIYGSQITIKSKPLLQQFVNNKNNIKIGSYDFLDSSNNQYLLLLQKHIILTKAMRDKLQFDNKNFRFLHVSFGWLDTFTEEKLVCTMYNYLIVCVLKTYYNIRKRKYQQSKEILEKSITIANGLLELIKRDSYNSKDLNPINVQCLLRLLKGYWYYCNVIIEQSDRTTTLPKQRASIYYSCYKQISKIKILLNQMKIPEQFKLFYHKLQHYYCIISMVEYCIRMIKNCDLYLTQKPQLFQDSLGYCMRGLKIIPKKDDILQSCEWTILEGKRDQLSRTYQHLSYRNKQIYKTYPTPDQMLIQEQSKIKPPQTKQQLQISQINKQILKEFWDTQVDKQAEQLQFFVNDSVEKIKTEFISLQRVINSLVTQKRLKQQKVFMQKLKQFCTPQGFNRLIQNIQTTKQKHNLIQNKIMNLYVNQTREKIKKWSYDNLKKLQQGGKVNSKLKQVLLEKKQKLLKISIKNAPRLQILKQNFQSLFSKIQELQQLKLKPYHQILLKKWKSNELNAQKQQIRHKIVQISKKWKQQISKLKGKVLQISKTNISYQMQFVEQIMLINNKQQLGTMFYTKLEEQLEKIKSS